MGAVTTCVVTTAAWAQSPVLDDQNKGNTGTPTESQLDPTLNEADLGVTYESMGVTDPAASRTEAVAVMSALLKQHPDLKANFHGLWAYAVKNGQRTFAIELPMAQIP